MKHVEIQKLHVQIGEVKIGQEGQVLTAILGSCIGLGFLYPKKGIYGLAHCLLSKSVQETKDITGRHVDSAIRSLQSLMEIEKDDLRKIQALVVGGANMTLPEDADPSRMVGGINARFAYKAVRKFGIRNIYEDVGGTSGRQVTIDCASGEFDVEAIPRLGAKS